ncbi:hypothetical protein CPCC7001_2247 [Cyanobium sp. PCC 7001]|nr:hypothetical protein CPCC7001_2247 [Cyanobium sp. PCC 7001]
MPLSSRYRPRRLRRNQVPLNSAGINAELVHEGQTLHHGIVWDLSWAGACLLVKAKQPLPARQGIQLLLYPSIGLGEVCVVAETIWCQIHGDQCFVGLRFLQEAVMQGSFLHRYLGDEGGGNGTATLQAA